jgi:hypothetical protein
VSPTYCGGTRPRRTGYSFATSFRLYNRAVTTNGRQPWDFADRSLCRLCPCGDRRPNLCASATVLGATSCFAPKRHDARYCSGECRTAIYRMRLADDAKVDDRPIFTVSFRAEQGINGVRAFKALRKFALQKYGLRAVTVPAFFAEFSASCDSTCLKINWRKKAPPLMEIALSKVSESPPGFRQPSFCFCRCRSASFYMVCH